MSIILFKRDHLNLSFIGNSVVLSSKDSGKQEIFYFQRRTQGESRVQRKDGLLNWHETAYKIWQREDHKDL